MKNRILSLTLLIMSLVTASWTGWHLKQAIEIERELRGQMADLSLVASTAPNHPASSTVTAGEVSLAAALKVVLHDGHVLEGWLALEAAGLLAGILLLRRTVRQNGQG